MTLNNQIIQKYSADICWFKDAPNLSNVSIGMALLQKLREESMDKKIQELIEDIKSQKAKPTQHVSAEIPVAWDEE